VALLRVTLHDGSFILPPWEVIQNQDATGRITKWALELMGEGITYAPHAAIKSQVLVDFIAKWTEV
jgi:hypothetical protein